MTPALAARVAQIEAEREHAAAIAEFRARRIADERSRQEALLRQAVHVLAVAMLGSHPRKLCYGCGYEIPGHAPGCWGPDLAARTA